MLLDQFAIDSVVGLVIDLDLARRLPKSTCAKCDSISNVRKSATHFQEGITLK